MRRKFMMPALALMVASSMMMSSCIGSFSLTNRLLDWNRQVGDKFVNELVFFAFWILPVYEVSALADLLVLNSIEFWSGNSPLASGSKIVDGKDGKYLVENDANGYTITSKTDGTVVRLDHNAETDEWSYTIGDNDPVVFLTFVDPTHVEVPAYDGSTKVVELTAEDVMAYSDYASGRTVLMAQR